jgi:hypothetical protein
MRSKHLLTALLLVASASAVRAQDQLTITSAQPNGELGSLAQANEIRIRFSEPMVTLGKMPDQVTAPFFSVRPAISGTFRWAGPTILIFTPDPKTPLPFATRYDVTIAATATSVGGRRLDRPFTFSFTTPTVRLLSTTWYRDGGRYDRKIVIPLRFNQPVRAADVIAHVAARYEPHEWTPPDMSPAELQQMGPVETAKFNAKVAASRATTRSSVPIRVGVAANWDRQRFPPSPDLVVIETVAPPALDGWVRLTVDMGIPAIQGRATPATEQSHVIQLEHALFVDAFYCRSQCDADGFNYARLRESVRLDALKRRTTVRDISAGVSAVVRPSATPRETYRSRQEDVELFNGEDLGYDRQTPDRTWAYTIDGSLTAVDGQTLGYTWTGIIENWHDSAFVSFGDGHGVWEKDGGPLPFYARNFSSTQQWVQRLTPDQLMPTILNLQGAGFGIAPPTNASTRPLGVTADRIQSHGLNLSSALGPAGTGLVWAAIQPTTTIQHARPYGGGGSRPTATVVQVTNLGITVKDSPQNTLVFVTRLDNGVPVDGADISIIRLDNSVAWKGRTNADGVALAPPLTLRNPRVPWQFSFIVTAAKDGDIAYVGSDWHEGIEPYMFSARYDLEEQSPLLRGTVFSDRGVYKLGEEVHFKAILRQDAPSGIQLIASGTPLFVLLKDARDKVVERRTVTMNGWSATEWVTKLPTDSALGNYQLLASLDKDALEPSAPKPEDLQDALWQSPDRKVVHASFLVAAYRRPDFRVDANLAGDSGLAGAPLKGVVNARYLFGAAMQKRPVAWTFSRMPVFTAPVAVLNKFPPSRFTFVGWRDYGRYQPGDSQLQARSASLDAQGQLQLDLDTPASDGYPYQYTFEGDVEDVSRQHIAGRAATVVHPAPWYIGLQHPSLFVSQKDGLATTVVAVSPAGAAVPGVNVELSLVEVQYHSVRRAEGNGFYSWDTTRNEAEVGHFTVTSAVEPVPLAVPLKNGGSYVLRATATDGTHKAITQLAFYALGAGYTAWERYDHNRIDLVPEQETYKPGDTARLMIKSPWEEATALLTVEREGIRSHSTFKLTSTQQTVTVPISAADIPNLFVSVVLIKGRTKAEVDDTSDPGKPTFRIGYARLNVEDASKRLSVSVKADRDEFRPAGSAKVDVFVKDAQGAPAASEVTLWAVDYGVLSLTGFKTPDVLKSVYVEKALQVTSVDSRQRIVSRRVLTPKGESDGGGGGAESGVSQLRKDFRVLAFWLGSVTTDGHGHASANIKLPESLTTYRIMAVAADKASRFGSGDSEIRINKPVVLKAAFPRFMTKGDKAYFGSVVTSQLKEPGWAIVTMRSLDPAILQVSGDTRRVVQVSAGGSAEVRFDVVATGVGRARIQTTARLGGEDDAFEDSIPVEVTVSPESVAVYGEAAPDAKQPFELPKGVVPGVGGLRVEVSSTALVGLHEGARYVVEYPYGCAEQRASRAFVMAVASDLGEAFTIQGIDAKDLRARTQAELKGLEAYQCSSGGFAYWPGECLTVSAYLTSYVLDVYQTAASLKYQVDRDVMERAYDYLQRELAEPAPVNEGWWPAYTAWESFAVKVLVKGGRNQDSNITRLYEYRDRMPVFALAYLADAMTAKGETGARPAELRRRIENSILPEAGTSHVEELADPYLLYFWNSNIRSTALVLSTKVQSSAPSTEVVGMTRWLLGARKNGRWGNTQENAIAMKALVDYYRKYESITPDFTATVSLGAKELVKETFKGRTTSSVVKEVPMMQLAQIGSGDIAVRREGAGTAFFNARLTYAPDAATLTARDNGFHIERRYALIRDGADAAPGESFAAGDLIRVTLSLDLPKERRYVAVTDPIPAGFEPVESWFATTAADLAKANDQEDGPRPRRWDDIWRRGTFDHVERHDDRVDLFATRLASGHHEFSYIVRATTAGTFVTAPTRAEEMYAPEISGRASTQTIEVRR